VAPGDVPVGSGETAFPSRRVVLIGASNLAIGLPAVVEAAREAWGRPLDVMAALGHGRSYGKTSRVFWRTLPGITVCRLWDDLAQRPAAATAALITDVGNDVLFGVPTDTIVSWVEDCLVRLAAVSARTIVTSPPLESLCRVGPRRFLIMRSILFPKCRLELGAALAAARELHERIAALAQRHGAPLVVPSPSWYGFDPIHLRRSQRANAWRHIFSHWQSVAHSEPIPRASRRRLSRREAWSLRMLKPHERCVFGQLQQHRQPAARLADGTLISLY